MKAKTIIWKFREAIGLDWLKPEKDQNTNAGVPRSSFGYINNITWFEIRREGKKSVKYILLSYPISTEHFTRANNSKRLGEFQTPEAAAEKAQEIFNEFVNSLID